MPEASRRPRVALFVTCLVDLHRPTVGFAAIRLLEQAGCQVEVPRAQTCCGQPAYNAGDRATARDLAAGLLDAFSGYDYVVVPSGSCGGMISHHFAGLFDNDPQQRTRAEALHWNRLYEPASIARDTRIKQGLKSRGLTVESHNAALLVEPWTVETGQGDPYRVFTPFWKNARQRLDPKAPPAAPDRLPEIPVMLAGLGVEDLKLEPQQPEPLT